MIYSNPQPFAQGGVAELFLVQLDSGRKAILRWLKSGKIFNLPQHLSFLNGIKVRAALTPHKNIVSSLELGRKILRPYEIIEYIQGDNLKLLYNYRSPLLKNKAEEILTSAAAGLAWVHKVGYMHLDVKPENFLCLERDNPIVKLTDFDLARPGDDLGKRKQMGTLAYMAPEQFRKHTSSRASDVFAFAIMAYQIFTGKMPFTGDSVKETIKHQSSDSVLPKPPMEHNPAIPRKWNAAIMKGLEKSPEKRLQDMNAWLDFIN